MPTPNRTLLAVLLMVAAPPAPAAAPLVLDCSDDGSALFDTGTAKALGRAEPAEGDFFDCKPWPADPTRTLHVIAGQEPGSASEDLIEYDLDVLVTETATGKILARHRQRKALVSDAIRIQGVGLDTARYQLAPGRRAFGVRVAAGGNSRYNPYSTEQIWLYLEDGKDLRLLLGDLPVKRSSGEINDDCSGEITDMQRSLQIEKTSNQGLADIAVVTKATTVKLGGDPCEEIRGKPVTRRDILRHDGRAYPLPKSLRE